MVALTSLWLPIVLATVLIMFASFLMNTVMPHHKSDYRPIPDEGRVLDALRALDLAPGQYVFPRAMTPEGMKEEGAMERMKGSPVGFLLMMESGPPNMAKALTYHFLFVLAVSFSVAYVASRTLAPGAEYLAVFRIVGTVAFLAYSAGEIPHAIWMGRPWGSTWKFVIDGFIYGLLTAGVFGWLWPA